MSLLPKIKRLSIWPKSLDILWMLALISLPVTSFPIFVRLTGAMVAPLAALPVILIFIFWFVPYIIRRGKLPRESFLLVVFLLVVLVSCASVYFIETPSFKGKTIIGQEVRSIISLGFGLAFYFVFASWPKERTRLQKLWQGINLGGIILIVWTMLQAFFILRHWDSYPGLMHLIQKFLVYRSPQAVLSYGRVNGFTYEASWFAHQMVILYLPLWMAATYQRTSAFKFRLWKISLENILLLFGLVDFYLSSPRVGMISFLLSAGYLFLMLNLRLLRKLTNAITNLPFIQSRHIQKPVKVLASAVISLLFIAGYAALLAAVVYISTQRDWRLSLIFQRTLSKQEWLGVLAFKEEYLLYAGTLWAFMERIIYWITGLRIFQMYPWLGVGLGNVGFFFPLQVPDLGYATVEIRSLLYRLKAFPNVKALWVRLLAETGVVGFSIFITWLYTLFRSARLSYHSADPAVKTIALAGQLALIAFIGEGFSIDSFAMPYLWVIAGLISAAGLIYRHELEQQRASATS